VDIHAYWGWVSDIERQVTLVIANAAILYPMRDDIINALLALGYICWDAYIKPTDKLAGADFRIMLAELENYLVQNKED
jgi:hypothetical protein